MSRKTTPKTTAAEQTIAPITSTDLPELNSFFSVADLAAPVFSEELANESLCIDNEADVPALPQLLAVLPTVRVGALDNLNGNPTFPALKKLCNLATSKTDPQTIMTSIGNIDFNRGEGRSQVSWTFSDFRTKKNPSAKRLADIDILQAVLIPGLKPQALRDISTRTCAKGQGQLMAHITSMAILRATSSWHNLAVVEQAHYRARAHVATADAVIDYTFGTSLEGVILATAIAIAGGTNLFTVAIYNGVATALNVGLIELPEGIIDANQEIATVSVKVVKNPLATVSMEA